MMRLIVLMIVCGMCLGCGRSADNGAGFDQAVQDMRSGVQPAQGTPSENYRRGYREAVDAVDGGLRRNHEHAADQKRAQQFHERMPRKK